MSVRIGFGRFQGGGSPRSTRDEATILQGIQHPNIIEVADVFESDRFLYVVMELVGGGELFKAIARQDIDVTEKDVIQRAPPHQRIQKFENHYSYTELISN